MVEKTGGEFYKTVIWWIIFVLLLMHKYKRKSCRETQRSFIHSFHLLITISKFICKQTNNSIIYLFLCAKAFYGIFVKDQNFEAFACWICNKNRFMGGGFSLNFATYSSLRARAFNVVGVTVFVYTWRWIKDQPEIKSLIAM